MILRADYSSWELNTAVEPDAECCLLAFTQPLLACWPGPAIMRNYCYTVDRAGA